MPEDGLILNEAVVESLEKLKPWMKWARNIPTLEESEDFCKRAYAKFLLNEELILFLIEKDTGTLLGSSGLHFPNWDLKQFEIGYWCREGFGGKGFITEGAEAISNYAFKKLKASRVCIKMNDLNTSSWRVAERLGYELEGIIRNEKLDVYGKFQNTRIYSKVT